MTNGGPTLSWTDTTACPHSLFHQEMAGYGSDFFTYNRLWLICKQGRRRRYMGTATPNNFRLRFYSAPPGAGNGASLPIGIYRDEIFEVTDILVNSRYVTAEITLSIEAFENLSASYLSANIDSTTVKVYVNIAKRLRDRVEVWTAVACVRWAWYWYPPWWVVNRLTSFVRATPTV